MSKLNVINSSNKKENTRLTTAVCFKSGQKCQRIQLGGITECGNISFLLVVPICLHVNCTY